MHARIDGSTDWGKQNILAGSPTGWLPHWLAPLPCRAAEVTRWRRLRNGQEPVMEQIWRKWNWLGHTLRNDDTVTIRNYSGHHKDIEEQCDQGVIHRRKNLLKRADMMWRAGYKYSWRKMKVTTQDRAGWDKWPVTFVTLGVTRHMLTKSSHYQQYTTHLVSS